MLHGKREIIQVGLIWLYEPFKSEEEGGEEVGEIQSVRTQHSFVGFEDGGRRLQAKDCGQPPEAGKISQLTASKEMGTSVLQLYRTKFCWHPDWT